MIKLAAFDLDGTTVNSLNSIAYFANKTLAKFNLPTFPVDSYRTLAGGGAKKLIRNLITATGAPEELYLPMLSDWTESYDADFLYLTERYDGIDEMLLSLKEAGIFTAVITNKHGSTGRKICESLFGTDGRMLDRCVADFPGMALKPSPDEILKLMSELNAKPDESIYCGDHVIDMKMGKNAGVITVGVLWGFHNREELIGAGADYIAAQPSDITALVRKLSGK